MKTSHFHKRLLERIDRLKSEDTNAAQSRATVTLDQQSVGRLSRMDAMQQQAMANAVQQRRKAEILKAERALQRIEDGEFSFCVDCGDDIAAKRLENDPAIALCLDCACG